MRLADDGAIGLELLCGVSSEGSQLKMKGESKTSVRRVEAADKQKQALDLRRDGFSYEAIAEALGYASPSGAHKAIMSALYKTLKEPAEELRTLELQRLDAAQSAIAVKVKSGDLYAIDRWVKIIQQRCLILGLNAPVEIKVQELVQTKVTEEINLLFETIAADPNIPTEAKQRMFAAASQLKERSSVAGEN